MKFLILLGLALAAVASASPATSGSSSEEIPDEELEWPKKYSFEITKLTVTSGLAEDIKVWRTSKQSRVEYNKGAVMSFVLKGRRHSRGTRYEIHPETSAGDATSTLVCHSMRRTSFDEPEDILPPVEGFERVGVEIMKNEYCAKFVNEESDENNNVKVLKNVLWATYDKSIKAWIPVRYEVVEFNTWLGSNDKHEIWDFDFYNEDFDEKEIFNVKEFCSNSVSEPIHHEPIHREPIHREPIHHEPIHHKTIHHDINDEAVTKHLLFMNPDKKEHVDHVFNKFKETHNRNYAHEKEHAMRRSIFQRNMRLIVSTNRKNLGYKLSVNKFADRTREEMKRHTGLLRRKEGDVGTHPFPYDAKKLAEISTKLPSEHDLRILGLISPIENQGDCGSCWAFGTTSAVEGALARSNGGKLMRLSPQALVDCDWEFGSFGCDGGTDAAAYKFMIKYGLPTEAEYGTYENKDGFCLIENMTTTFPIKGFVDVSPNSVGALKVAVVNHGPLSVSVAATEAFSLYSGGVFYDFQCENDPSSLNHEISLVGYGEFQGDTFWIVKNSWGPDWGIDGYMHISARDNNCGIMTEPTYVLF